MHKTSCRPLVVALFILLGWHHAVADGNLGNLKHIIIVMQENHSFDNYLGVLGYAPGTPYHNGACSGTDHSALTACLVLPT